MKSAARSPRDEGSTLSLGSVEHFCVFERIVLIPAVQFQCLGSVSLPLFSAPMVEKPPQVFVENKIIEQRGNAGINTSWVARKSTMVHICSQTS